MDDDTPLGEAGQKALFAWKARAKAAEARLAISQAEQVAAAISELLENKPERVAEALQIAERLRRHKHSLARAFSANLAHSEVAALEAHVEAEQRNLRAWYRLMTSRPAPRENSGRVRASHHS